MSENVVKVLHIIGSLGAGGAETTLHTLLTKTDCSAIRSEVYSLGGDGPIGALLRRDGIPTVNCDRSSGNRFEMLLRLMSYCRKSRPDVIQGWMYSANFAATAASFWSRGSIHGWNVRSSLQDLANEPKRVQRNIKRCRALSSFPTWIIYDSKQSAKQHEDFGFNRGRTRYIPNGFDLNLLRPDPVLRQTLRAVNDLSDSDFVVGMIGRYHPIKGHSNFIKAAMKVAAQAPNVRFVLVGQGLDWGNKYLTSEIQAAGIENRFRLLGKKENGGLIPNMLDLHVLASRAESAPNVIGEAMACGVMTVATDVGDSEWMMGKTGVVVPREDPDELARAILGVVALPARVRAEFGERAREIVIERFSLEAFVTEYSDLYINASSFAKRIPKR